MSLSEINVGAQIRAFRKKKKLSLIDLSKITGIAASNLSSIELGKSSPTLNTLVKIAAAFRLRPGVFLDEVLYKRAILCPKGESDKQEIFSSQVSMEFLNSKVPLRRMDAKIFTLKGADRQASLESLSSDGFVYCLCGAVTAEVDAEVYKLGEGDGLYLLPEAKINFQNLTPADSSLFVVTLKIQDANG